MTCSAFGHFFNLVQQLNQAISIRAMYELKFKLLAAFLTVFNLCALKL